MLSDILPSNTRLIIARAFNHSGPGQDERFVLPSFAAQIARIETGRVPARMMVGNLDSERDYLHVADVVDAYVLLVGAANHLDSRMVVNVASGRAWRISSLLAMMRDMALKPFEIINDPARMRASDVPIAVGDAAKLRKLTGWEPQHQISDMLREIINRARAEVCELES
jgi:GDP-4-dehydro-6-deoxy-D-mannose reductase